MSQPPTKPCERCQHELKSYEQFGPPGHVYCRTCNDVVELENTRQVQLALHITPMDELWTTPGETVRDK